MVPKLVTLGDFTTSKGTAEPHTGLHTFRVWPMLSHGALICTLMFFFALWTGTPSSHLHDDIPIYSPAHVAVEPVIVRFNGTLDFPSIYRGPPSPEIDAACARIAQDVLPTRMSLEEFVKAGEVDSPSKVKYPAEFGGGSRGIHGSLSPTSLSEFTSQSLVARVLESVRELESGPVSTPDFNFKLTHNNLMHTV
ncbi:hypothetical protein F4604DRAFT_265513 [Suillus subluteus]|nr:hypothetical protein F4604DRAFT_265513 [Suillus subluteus]